MRWVIASVVKGHHACVRCNGSGVVPSSRDAGKCYRCKGKGYTTIIDRERNAAHSRHRKARIEAIRTAHANA
jgi:DnaJ-class molecular chaperone